MGSLPLAEAPQFTAADVSLIIVVLLVTLLVVGSVAVMGFVLAGRAAAGSRNALMGWVAVLVAEVLFGLAVVYTGGLISSAVVFLVIAAQAGLFLARRKGGSGPPGDQ